MVRYEEATGINPIARNPFDEDLTPKQVLAFLWSCLLHEEPTLTMEQVGHMVDSSNIFEMHALLLQACKDALPELAELLEDDDASPLPESRPVGSTSGPSGGTTSSLKTQSSGGSPTENLPP